MKNQEKTKIYQTVNYAPIQGREINRIVNFLAVHYEHEQVLEMCLIIDVNYQDVVGTTQDTNDNARKIVNFLIGDNRLNELTSYLNKTRFFKID